MNFWYLPKFHLGLTFRRLLTISDNKCASLIVTDLAFVVAAAIPEYRRTEKLFTYRELDSDRYRLICSHLDRLVQHNITNVIFNVLFVTEKSLDLWLLFIADLTAPVTREIIL